MLITMNMNEEQKRTLDTYLLSPEWDALEPDAINPNAPAPEEDPDWKPSWWVDDPEEQERMRERALAEARGDA